MNISVSNLGWNKSENTKVLNFLSSKKVKNIEFALNKLLENHETKKKSKILNYYKKKNINLSSAQSLLYGYKDSFIFGSKKQRYNFTKNIQTNLKKIKFFNTKAVVFGSPQNKKIFKKNKKILDKIAYNEFKKIASISKKLKIVFCLEANPIIYNCDYIKKTSEALKLVKKINSEYFKLNIDTGTIIANNESIKFINKNNLKYIGHVQVSVPYLKSIFTNQSYLKKITLILRMLKKLEYKNNISLETLNIGLSELKKNVHFILRSIK